MEGQLQQTASLLESICLKESKLGENISFGGPRINACDIHEEDSKHCLATDTCSHTDRLPRPVIHFIHHPFRGHSINIDSCQNV